MNMIYNKDSTLPTNTFILI